MRGNPYLISNQGDNKGKVVRFDGFSQLFSTFDFGGFLNDYSIFAVARHTGGQDNSVISSVGSDWIFGLGNGMSGFWKLGGTEVNGPSSDTDWHILTGTMGSDGTATLRRDGYSMAVESTVLNQDAKPKYLSLGGSQANDLYSKSEVAEVFLYNRVLNESEISSLESYLRVKWMGGSLENFPLLVRLNDLQSFASNDGGDLRFYDGQHKPLPFAIDEWNSSGESIIWVQVDDFSADSDIFAYWGNEDNTTLPVHDIWSDYSGVWHLSSARDDTSSGNDASSVGSADLNVSALIGNGLRLSSSGHLSATGYKGILDGDARTVSLWMRSVDSPGPLLSWGAPSNYWEISLE